MTSPCPPRPAGRRRRDTRRRTRPDAARRPPLITRGASLTRQAPAAARGKSFSDEAAAASAARARRPAASRPLRRPSARQKTPSLSRQKTRRPSKAAEEIVLSVSCRPPARRQPSVEVHQTSARPRASTMTSVAFCDFVDSERAISTNGPCRTARARGTAHATAPASAPASVTAVATSSTASRGGASGVVVNTSVHRPPLTATVSATCDGDVVTRRSVPTPRRCSARSTAAGAASSGSLP